MSEFELLCSLLVGDTVPRSRADGLAPKGCGRAGRRIRMVWDLEHLKLQLEITNPPTKCPTNANRNEAGNPGQTMQTRSGQGWDVLFLYEVSWMEITTPALESSSVLACQEDISRILGCCS